MHFCHNPNGTVSQPTALQAVCFGAIARSFSGSILIPVTVIKTRYESGIFSYGSLSHALKHTYASEGVRGLMSGLLPTLMRDAPFSGLYFMFYSQLRHLAQISSSNTSKNNKSVSPIITFTIGLNAGLMASVVTHPMDVVCIAFVFVFICLYIYLVFDYPDLKSIIWVEIKPELIAIYRPFYESKMSIQFHLIPPPQLA